METISSLRRRIQALPPKKPVVLSAVLPGIF